MNDIDVIYYDRNHLSRKNDEEFESELRALNNRYNWSVKNQARMHVRNSHLPYGSVEEALRQWPEVCTAVGVRFNDNNSWTVVSPYGLDDLFSLVIRRSLNFRDEEYFMKRIESKSWLTRWSKLKIVKS